jgi:hypothetical protein
VGGGGTTDYVAALTVPVSWAEGSFPSVTGVTSEQDTNGALPSDTSLAPGQANTYSLQLNTGYIPYSVPQVAALCNYATASNVNCYGWQQFVFDTPTVVTPEATYTPTADIEYWLMDYGSANCPLGWYSKYYTKSNGGIEYYCYANSNQKKGIPAQKITNLSNMTLTGTAGTTDSVVLSTGDGQLYAQSAPSVLGLNSYWYDAEFNVFGYANGSNAQFNNGASIVVQILTDTMNPSNPSPSSTTAPTYLSTSYTGETNSLSLQPTSPVCQIGGAIPGIQFMESNASNVPNWTCPADPTLQPALLWWNKASGAVQAWQGISDPVPTHVGANVGVANATSGVTLTQNCALVERGMFIGGCAAQWSVVDTVGNSILWFNSGLGELEEWVFDAQGDVSIPPIINQTCSSLSGCYPSWTPVGRLMEGSQAGLLWYQASTGELEVWDLLGTTFTGSAFLNWTNPGSNGWTPVLTADFNGDGNTDVLWYQPSTGTSRVWLLNGTQVIGVQSLSFQCSTNPGGACQGWSIIGAGDINQDGHTDLTWYNAASGAIETWILDGNGTVVAFNTWNQSCPTGCAEGVPIGLVSFP